MQDGDQPEGGQGQTREIEVTHRTDFRFALDEEKIQAIKRCLEKGELRISVTGVDLRQGGRFQSSYLYD